MVVFLGGCARGAEMDELEKKRQEKNLWILLVTMWVLFGLIGYLWSQYQYFECQSTMELAKRIAECGYEGNILLPLMVGFFVGTPVAFFLDGKFTGE
ncbi:MAG: hypothetical protein VCA36_13425 [Opitutales bacterium]